MTEVGVDPAGAEVPEEPAVPAPGRAKRSRQRSAIEWALLIGGALLIALLVRTYAFQTFYIPSDSMLPTLETNDRIVVNKLSYRLHDVNRGDIVVFDAPEELRLRTPHLVKRVIGLPNETIEGKNGHVYIDGERLAEPYLPDGTTMNNFGPTKIAPGHYFVMGDNRQASEDSRIFNAIDESTIVGRAFVRIWPLSRAGFL